MKHRKGIALVLMLAMLMSCAPAAGLAADEEAGGAIFYNRTYDEEGRDPFEGALSVPKSNSITAETDEDGNQYIKAAAADTQTEDLYFEVTMNNPTRYIMWEASLSADNPALGGDLQFKDASRTDGRLLTFGKDGTVSSAGSGAELGQLKKGEWLDLAVALDLQEMTYSVYVNGELAEEDTPVSGSPNGMILLRMYFTNGNAGRDMLIDNYRIYEGTEPRDITGMDTVDPEHTFVPSAAPTASSGPVKEEQETLVLDVTDKAALEALGLTQSKEQTNSADYSAQWTLADKPNLVIEDIPHDVRGFYDIRFSIYGKKGTQLFFRLDSNNPATTDGDDYYGTKLTLNVDGWNDFDLIISSLGKSRTPLGYDQIEAIKLFSTGWEMNNDPDTVLYLDNLYFDVSDLPTPTPTANPTDLSRVSKAVCLKLGAPNALVNLEKTPIEEGSDSVVPYTENDRTLVPLRFIGESLGASVSYDGSEGIDKIEIKYAQDTLNLTVGSDIMLKNGSEIKLDTAATITGDDRTFVPLRAIAEAFGKEVFWDDMGLIVISDTKDIFNRDTDLSLMLNVMASFIYERPDGETVIADLKRTSPSHPRVLANAADFDRIRTLYASDENMKAWIDRVIQSADASLDASAPTYSVDEGGRLKGTGTDGMMQNLGLAYQVTGDQKYVDAAWKHLEAVCSFDNWHPGHFLDAAGIMKGVAIGYDWMYDGFTAQQRSTIEAALFEKGIQAGIGAYAGTTEDMEPAHGTFGRSGWTNTENNWNAVCNSGLTLASAAIGDLDAYSDEIAGLMEDVLRSIEKGIICYAPDGSYPEGPGYWSYGTNNLFYMIECLDKAMGTDYGIFDAPGLDTTCYFPVYMEGPRGQWNLNDCSEGSVDTSHFMWVAQKVGNYDLAGIRLNDILTGTKSAAVSDILFYDPSKINENVSLPLDRYFSGTQIATMRSAFNDSGALFCGLHGGYNSVNHGNLDSGTFIIDAGGQRFISDIGSDNYNLPSYFGGGTGGARWNYYRNRAEGHNTVIVNPGLGEDQVATATTQITRFESKPKGAIAVVDMAPAHGAKVEKAQRGELLTDNRRAVIIQDEMTLPEAGEVWWFAHVNNGEITVAPDGKSAVIEKGGKRMYAGIVSPMADAKFTVMAAEPLPSSPQSNPAEYDRSAYQKLAIHSENVTEYKMAVVFRLLEGEQSSPDFTYTWTDIDSWSIPDGNIVVPTLSDLKVNGETIENFRPGTTNYEYVLPFGSTQPAQIEAVASGDFDMQITQASSLPGSATVRLTDKNDPNMYTIYSVDMRAAAEIEITASEVPEPENVPANTMDGDLGTRWAAEGEQWIRYDFANPREISAVWIAFWKSDARSTLFKIEVSEDGENFKTVFDGQQSNKEDALAEYRIDPVVARSVRITGYGNTSNAWTSVLEVEFR